MIGTVLCYVLLPAARLLRALRGNPAPGGRRQEPGEAAAGARRGGVRVLLASPPGPACGGCCLGGWEPGSCWPPRSSLSPSPQRQERRVGARAAARGAVGACAGPGRRGGSVCGGKKGRRLCSSGGCNLRGGPSLPPRPALRVWGGLWRRAAPRPVAARGPAGDSWMDSCFACISVSLSFLDRYSCFTASGDCAGVKPPSCLNVSPGLWQPPAHRGHREQLPVTSQIQLPSYSNRLL